MVYEKSPLKIVVVQAESQAQIMAMNVKAYTYRRSDVETKNKSKNYWEPQGSYFVRYGGNKFAVEFTGNGFLLKITSTEYLKLLNMYRGKDSYVSNGQSTKAEDCQRRSNGETEERRGAKQAPQA